jgi:preprotein translocase subunit SecY
MFLIEELGEFGAEIKLSLFQLGLSPQIIASIIMQVKISPRFDVFA